MEIEKAKELIDQGDINIIDIRDPDSYAEAHIDSAVNVNNEAIENYIKTADKDKTLLCFCFHGFSSQNAAQYFVEQGFKDVHSVEGGMEKWKEMYEVVSD